MNALQAITQTVIPKETIQNPKVVDRADIEVACVAGECCGETRYICAYYIVPGLFCDLSFIKILQIRCLCTPYICAM